MVRELMDKETGQRFSANRDDYFMADPNYPLKGLMLVEKVPLRKKNVVMGSGWKIIKRNPKIKDLKSVL